MLPPLPPPPPPSTNDVVGEVPTNIRCKVKAARPLSNKGRNRNEWRPPPPPPPPVKKLIGLGWSGGGAHYEFLLIESLAINLVEELNRNWILPFSIHPCRPVFSFLAALLPAYLAVILSHVMWHMAGLCYKLNSLPAVPAGCSIHF